VFRFDSVDRGSVERKGSKTQTDLLLDETSNVIDFEGKIENRDVRLADVSLTATEMFEAYRDDSSCCARSFSDN
jgi:hypothetical protein